MKLFITLMLTVVTFISASAYEYSYSFNNTPISDAIVRISKDHPEVNINFIYKELDNYRTSAKVYTNDAYEALRQTIWLNPISIIKKDWNYYIEALQHGKFCYAGKVIGSDNEPVVAATVMLLAPQDSTVLTYGIADENGRFSIPCDKRDVIAKLSCTGYKTTYRRCPDFNCGAIIMPINSVILNQVQVEGQNATAYSDRTVYIPTSRQKHASQTGSELLNRMAIPQLKISDGDNIETASGQAVAIYINFLPASQNDLTTMRTADVKRVDYLDYPSDPRFQGNAHVINFIMQQYEYGGYVKAYANENLGVLCFIDIPARYIMSIVFAYVSCFFLLIFICGKLLFPKKRISDIEVKNK